MNARIGYSLAALLVFSALGACGGGISAQRMDRVAEGDRYTSTVKVDSSVARACHMASEPTYFTSASADAEELDTKIVEGVASCMGPGGHLDKRAILITGYTDTDGTNEDNRVLGMRRATAVGRELVSQGVASNRIFLRSVGDRYAHGETEYEKSGDRRVVLVVID